MLFKTSIAFEFRVVWRFQIGISNYWKFDIVPRTSAYAIITLLLDGTSMYINLRKFCRSITDQECLKMQIEIHAYISENVLMGKSADRTHILSEPLRQ